MTTPTSPLPDPRRLATIEQISRISGSVVLAVGALVVLGWGIGLSFLTAIAPSLGTMTATSAVCFVLVGTALRFFRRRSLTAWLAAPVVFIGAITSIEYAIGVDLGRTVITETGMLGPPGRMTPSSALAFLLAGSALLILAAGSARVAHALAIGLFVAAFTAFLGHLFDVTSLDEIAVYVTMSLHSSITFLIAAVGILAARPAEGLTLVFANHGAGGLMVRRVLPLAIATPVLTAWSVLFGLRAGIYDARFAVALGAVITVVLLGVLLVWTAGQMFSVDTQRRQAERRLRDLNVELEQKVAERTAELETSEEFFRSISENMSDLVIRMDADGRIVYTSPAVRDLLGYEPDEVIGRTALDFIPREAASEIDRVYGIVHNGGSASTQQPVRRKDGSEVWLEGIASPITDPTTGRISGIVWVVRDFSGHLEALEQERTIAHRQERLNELKSEFVSVVAHDLKAPLTVIRGFADLLLQGEPVDRDDVTRRILDAANRLNRLVDDLLEVGRIESGAVVFATDPFDVGRLVASVTEEMSSTDPGRPVELRISPTLPPAIGDQERTWRVLTNLLSNAFKFSPSGEPVEVEATAGEGMVKVSVRDHGPGIPPEEVDKLFRRFSRLNTSSAAKGHGLGLYIAKSLIEGQGGTIALETTPGEGACFTFTLPAKAP